jgi:hypothetical protein
MMDHPVRPRRGAAWHWLALGAIALGAAACDKNPVVRIGDRHVELPRFMLIPPPRPAPTPPAVVPPPAVAAAPPGAIAASPAPLPGDFGAAEPRSWRGAAWDEHAPERDPVFPDAPAALPSTQPAPGITAEPLDDPAPRPQRAAAPADRAGGDAAQLRRNPWIARFWSQLSGAQRSRVAGRLQLDQAAAAREWDRMGLGDRIRLLYAEGAGAGA